MIQTKEKEIDITKVRQDVEYRLYAQQGGLFVYPAAKAIAFGFFAMLIVGVLVSQTDFKGRMTITGMLTFIAAAVGVIAWVIWARLPERIYKATGAPERAVAAIEHVLHKAEEKAKTFAGGKCPSCGTKQQRGAAFCEDCGANLSGTTVAEGGK